MANPKEVTIYDIAEALNLSASTVSRGLNGNQAIRKSTINKIRRTALAMGYQQNTFASNLRKNRSNTIGVILPRLDSSFQAAVVSGIEKVVNQKGFNLILSQSRESITKEKANIVTMFNSRVDGLLVSLACDTCNIDHLDLFMKKGTPVILFDRVKDHPTFQLTKVVISNDKAGYDATCHLIEQGCRKIMFVCDNLTSNVYSERHEGYRQALMEHKIPYGKEYVFVTTLDEDSGTRTLDKILHMKSRPDGIFATNDTSAVSIICSLGKAGIRVPEDIAVVGFNNVTISRVVEPSLTTIHYPGVEMGEIAASTLIDSLDNENIGIRKTVILEHKLIVRNSSLRKGTLPDNCADKKGKQDRHPTD